MFCCNHNVGEEEYNLLLQIDRSALRSLNTVEQNAYKIFRPLHHKNDQTPMLESDTDEQIIIVIPFMSIVKLTNISVIGMGEHSPSSLKAFVNTEVDFDNCDGMPPTQSWQLNAGETELSTRVSSFSNVKQLVLYFDQNHGEDVTQISYIGLKGVWSPAPKDAIITKYELLANPADHPQVTETLNRSIN
ncbi:PITH domain-containing protein [Gorgonomyces haynaldii]|nr:PITH domain-containing protein [Gorgonomyces haynaldii]